MRLGLALKEMIHQCQTTQKGLAEKAGYHTMSCITTPIARDDIKVSTLLRFAETLGYDLVLVKRDNVDGYPPIHIDPAAKEAEV
jgi:hypothetical protein